MIQKYFRSNSQTYDASLKGLDVGETFSAT